MSVSVDCKQALTKDFNFSMPQFPHLQKRDRNYTHPQRLADELNVIMHVRYLDQRLPQRDDCSGSFTLITAALEYMRLLAIVSQRGKTPTLFK